nr:DUF6282 family protein [uncultured Oscillibacter sp.]
MDNLLEGAYDLHIHCGPDVIPRAVTGLEMAKRAAKCGMRGFAIKAHYDNTCQQAALVNELVPSCRAIGTLTMNSVTGGVNPMAVEAAARLGARIVWCPTFDSDSQQKYYLKELPAYIAMQSKLLARGVAVPSYRLTNQEGRLTKEMGEVLELVQEYDMVLGTGHITRGETFALAREAHRRGFRRLLITHADWSFTHYSVEEQKELIRLGAVVEHSYTSPAVLNAVSWDEVFHEMREIGPEHIVVSTDLGQANHDYPDVGLQKYARKLLENKFSRRELRMMIAENPERLVSP